MIKSMTGFAAASGAQGPFTWTWELRSVNGRGLDLRLRVPDWIEGLEAGLRKKLATAAARGNVTCNLRVAREDGTGTVEVNESQVHIILEALQKIETHAMDAGVSLGPSKATDIVAMRGVLEQATPEADSKGLCAQLLVDAEALIAGFDAMRQSEGRALGILLQTQLDEVARLTSQAAGLAEARKDEMANSLRANLARVMDSVEGADSDRVAQELALIAVKADITEELDRLGAHVMAARDLLSTGGPVGRKLDFLMQEFNREANTLCSKAQMKDMTTVGLALKVVIDQMREQVQNVE